MLAFNNQFNMHFQADDDPPPNRSWCTQIKVFGGKAQVLSAFAGGYAGSRGISIAKGVNNAVDGIDFYGTLIEGNAERKIYCEASWCSFINCYPDAQGPTATDIEFTATSANNFICGGSALDLQVISNSGSRNFFLIPKTFAYSGTFTPVLQFGGGTSGVAYTRQLGFYRKIGKSVLFNIHIALASKGSATGPASISGLPIATANVTAERHAFSVSPDAFAASVPNVYSDIAAGATAVSLYKFSGGVSAALTDTDFTNTSSVVISGQYEIDKAL